MDRTTHLVIGLLAFVAYSVVLDTLNKTAGFPWVIGLIVVCLGSVLPDILEPARSWRHRGMFHSLGALVIVLPLFCISSLVTIIVSFFPHPAPFYYASCFFLGYVFHLLADSVTPMGLPG